MRKLIVSILMMSTAVSLTAQRSVSLAQWQMKSTTEVAAPDAEVASVGYRPDAWYGVTVPTTVLNGLVANDVYPDPRTAMNNFLIPDVSDDLNARLDLGKYNYLKNGRNPWQDPYWFRTEVKLPSDYKGKRVWLKLNGINYRADVWVNGTLVASHDTIVGMFRRFKFDVTDCVSASKPNCIAVKVYQVDHPGTPSPGTQFVLFGPNRGTASDLFRDETLKFTGGWDCAPVIRDRNMGLYQTVELEATGDVTFDDPFVATTLPRNDTTLAHLDVTVPLVNHSSRTVTGVLTAKVTSVEEFRFPTYTKRFDKRIKPIIVKQRVEVAPHDTAVVRFTPEAYKALAIEHPNLWYPNGYGEQYLHNLALTFTPTSGAATSWNENFGIREVKTALLEKEYGDKGETEHGLIFYINGTKVFCRGGWLQPDALLADTEKGIYAQARLLANANVNIVGSEDMPSPDPAWLDSWDKYGLMNWHVFHQCYRMFPGRDTQDNPDDHALAAACVRDMVKRYRNHPCIVAWFGVNEVCVAEDLYKATKNIVKELDTTRPYVPTTSTSWDVDKLTPYLSGDLPTGTTDDGAPDYNWAPSDYYFDKVEEVYTQMFKNEMGMPGVPVYESLQKFIPTLDKPRDVRDTHYPLDSIWAEHGAWDANNFCFRAYDNALRTFYSDPVDARDYARKAQLVSAEGYRAMIEAANHRMFDITTGVMLWKLNSCWPDVCWQIYDWYLTPNAAYYFAKKAMEPVHVQLNANTERIAVVNASPRKLDKVVVKGRLVDFFQKEQWSLCDTVSLDAYSYKELCEVPKGGKLAAVYLVRLSLEDLDGNELSDNLYWRYSQHQNFYWLQHMPQGELTREVTTRCIDGREYEVTVVLDNKSDATSFFNYLTIGTSETSPSVNPVIWSDNFVTLLPGESKRLTARVAVEDLGGAQPVVRIENK